MKILIRSPGPRHLLHRPARRPPLDRAQESGQHPPRRLSIRPHRPARLPHGSLQRLKGRRNDALEGARR